MKNIITKKCSRCRETKPVSEFYLRGDKRPDPYTSHCKECKKTKMGDWYKNNSEHQKVKSKKWRLSNLLHCVTRDRIYNESHKDERSKQHKQWKEKNYDRVLQLNSNRRARKNNAEGSYTRQEFRELCERYGNKCLCCGESKKLTADHVVPITKGGANYIDNIQPLCGSCNSRKKDKTVDYRKEWRV